tara:strand:- start:550 stop:1185 length:636 start_codon:yes stop_codon:yes gene_type:complete
MTPEAKKIYMKEWRKKNREKIAAYEKEYKEKNKAAIAARARAYVEKNKETVSQKKKDYHFKNKERINAKSLAYFRENKERLNKAALEYYHANKDERIVKQGEWREQNRDASRRASKNWALNNQDKVIANIAKRRAAKMQRTPNWLTEEHRKQIEDIYREAKMREVETGIRHHVDHIIPLQGKLVSGLHVPNNLCVIPATENIRKRNHYQPN